MFIGALVARQRSVSNSSKEALVGKLPVRNVSSYLSKHPKISCTIYRDYDSSHPCFADSGGEDLDVEGQPKHSSEVIELVSRDLTSSIDAFYDYFKMDVNYAAFTKETVLSSPYLPIFHAQGSALDSFSETLNNAQQEQFELLLNYIRTEYEAEYNLVDNTYNQQGSNYRQIHQVFI